MKRILIIGCCCLWTMISIAAQVYIDENALRRDVQRAEREVNEWDKKQQMAIANAITNFVRESNQKYSKTTISLSNIYVIKDKKGQYFFWYGVGTEKAHFPNKPTCDEGILDLSRKVENAAEQARLDFNNSYKAGIGKISFYNGKKTDKFYEDVIQDNCRCVEIKNPNYSPNQSSSANNQSNITQKNNISDFSFDLPSTQYENFFDMPSARDIAQANTDSKAPEFDLSDLGKYLEADDNVWQLGKSGGTAYLDKDITKWQVNTSLSDAAFDSNSSFRDNLSDIKYLRDFKTDEKNEESSFQFIDDETKQKLINDWNSIKESAIGEYLASYGRTVKDWAMEEFKINDVGEALKEAADSKFVSELVDNYKTVKGYAGKALAAKEAIDDGYKAYKEGDPVGVMSNAMSVVPYARTVDNSASSRKFYEKIAVNITKDSMNRAKNASKASDINKAYSENDKSWNEQYKHTETNINTQAVKQVGIYVKTAIKPK